MIRTVADRFASRTRRPTYRGRHRRTRTKPTTAFRTPTAESGLTAADQPPKGELAVAAGGPAAPSA